MIPLRDVLPCQTVPVVTRGLVIVNVVIFAITRQDPMAAAEAMAAVPYHYTGMDPVLRPELIGIYDPVPRDWTAVPRVFTHMFMHGDFLHLLFNMWFLWIFGDNVEDRLGRVRYVALYLLAGLAALITQVAATPASGELMVGASGAIAGVLGAYLLLFPRAKVITLIPILFIPLLVALPASLFLWLWLAFQVMSGLLAPFDSGVAWWAHIGGFIAGMVLVSVLAPPRRKRIEVTPR